MARTLKELAVEALACQDACNSCGLVQAFARTMIDLGEHTKGTEDRNQHPITIVWLDKLNSLARIQDYMLEANDRVFAAFNAVHDLAEDR